MTKEFLELLLEYIDARLQENNASESSDGGLSDSIIRMDIRDELFAMLECDHGTS